MFWDRKAAGTWPTLPFPLTDPRFCVLTPRMTDLSLEEDELDSLIEDTLKDFEGDDPIPRATLPVPPKRETEKNQLDLLKSLESVLGDGVSPANVGRVMDRVVDESARQDAILEDVLNALQEESREHPSADTASVADALRETLAALERGAEAIKSSEAPLDTNIDLQTLLETLPNADDLTGTMDQLMGQVLSRDVLYGPLVDLKDKYDEWLIEHAHDQDAAELARVNKQRTIVQRMISVFGGDENDNDNGGEGNGNGGQPESSKQVEEIIVLLGDLQALGKPPPEIIAEMAMGVELDAESPQQQCPLQ